VAKNILYADDSATMQRIMSMTFAAEDMKVTAVPSGDAALSKAKEIRPDLVIADVAMPGMSGYDLCKAIRTDAALSGIPVILLGGVSSPYDETKGNQCGATANFVKPFETQAMLDKAKEIIAAGPVSTGAAAAAPAPAPAKPPAPARPAVPKPVSPMTSKATLPVTGVRLQSLVTAPSHPAEEEAASVETLEFGMPPMEAKPMRAPEPPRPAAKAEQVPVVEGPDEDEGDSYEVVVTPMEEAEGESFQTATLAEMAQLDEHGEPHPSYVDEAIPVAPVMDTHRSQRAAQPAPKGAATSGLTPEQAEAVMKLSRDVIEKVVWEVVPDLAETIIKERLEALLKK